MTNKSNQVSYKKKKKVSLIKLKTKKKLIVTIEDIVFPVLFLIPIIYFSLLQIYLNTAEQWQQNILVQKKDLAEQAKNVMHSVMSSYLDQINRDVQGRDQALNLLQQIIQTIIDTDSAIVQGIRS